MPDLLAIESTAIELHSVGGTKRNDLKLLEGVFSLLVSQSSFKILGSIFSPQQSRHILKL